MSWFALAWTGMRSYVCRAEGLFWTAVKASAGCLNARFLESIGGQKSAAVVSMSSPT